MFARMPKTAVYPGSFDVLTHGHLNIIERSSRMFDSLIVAVAENQRKSPLFSRVERLALLQGEVEKFGNVEVASFDGLTVEFARSRGAQILVRGLRAVSDFEYELQIAIANNHLYPDIETIFVPARPEFSFLSSSVVKEIGRLGGDVSEFVPSSVAAALRRRFDKAIERSESPNDWMR